MRAKPAPRRLRNPLAIRIPATHAGQPGVALTWATIALGARWRGEGGYLSRVAGRMIIGIAVRLLLMALLRRRMRWRIVLRRRIVQDRVGPPRTRRH